MERVDRDLLLELAPSHFELRKLYEQHERLEDELSSLRKVGNLSPFTMRRERELKKEKLLGMDSIMRILNEHRQAAA